MTRQRKAQPVDWTRVEALCLRSFTTGNLSDDEREYLAVAHRADPREYKARTHAVRESERDRVRSF